MSVSSAKKVASRPFLLLLDPSSLCRLKCLICPTGLGNAGKVDLAGIFYRASLNLLSSDISDTVLAE